MNKEKSTIKMFQCPFKQTAIGSHLGISNEMHPCSSKGCKSTVGQIILTVLHAMAKVWRVIIMTTTHVHGECLNCRVFHDFYQLINAKSNSYLNMIRENVKISMIGNILFIKHCKDKFVLVSSNENVLIALLWVNCIDILHFCKSS